MSSSVAVLMTVDNYPFCCFEDDPDHSPVTPSHPVASLLAVPRRCSAWIFSVLFVVISVIGILFVML